MGNNKIDEYRLNIFGIIVSVSLFFTTEVYLKWHSSMWTALGYIILLSLVYHIFLGKVKLSGRDLLFPFAFAILFLWSKGLGNMSIANFVITILIPFTLLIPWQKRELYMDFFITRFFPILIGISVVFYILYIAGYEFLPSSHIESLNEIKPYDYTSYVFFVVPNSLLESMRFCSYYDEPGVVGTLMGAIVFFYHKKLNIYSLSIYIVAGLLALSMFFFVAIFFWIFFSSQISFKKRIVIIFGLLVLGAIVLTFMSDTFQTDAIFERYSKDGVGDNSRNTGDFSNFFYGRFIHTDDLWTGYKGNTDIAGSSFSFEKTIFLKGLLYFIYGIGLYLLFFIRYKVSFYQFAVQFAFWFGLNYQRPSFDVLFFYIFFTTLLQSQYYRRNEEQADNKPVKRRNKVLISNQNNSNTQIIVDNQ